MLLIQRKCELLLKFFFTQFFLLSKGSLYAPVAFVELAVSCSFNHAMTPRFIGGIKAWFMSEKDSGSFCEPKLHNQYFSTNFTLVSMSGTVHSTPTCS